MTDKIPVIVICGPTGSGKTALALELSRFYPLEIVSADSRQVYRRMDIGTAKATAAEQAVVSHHLIDLIDPPEEFSVADYVERARPVIAEIDSRGRVPCVVGGTGLYIRALLGGLANLPGGDAALRAQLHRQEATEGQGTLFRRLQRVDPEAAGRIHPHNLIRIVRALEVYLLSGETITRLNAAHRFAEMPYRVLQLAPHWQRPDLYDRIDARSRQMLDLGLVDEVTGLLQNYPAGLKIFQTLGYREVLRYLRREFNAEEMLDEIRKQTRRYAKRQLTWFKKEAQTIWVDSSIKSGRVTKYIDDFLLR